MNFTRNQGQSVKDHGRLRALAQIGLLDTLPEERFDRYTRLAKAATGADVSLLSLVDRDRQFFKSQQGLPPPYDRKRETPLSHSFCKLVVEGGRHVVVEDAYQDDRVRGNLAIQDLGVVSYLGMPVRTEDGYLLGAMCVISGKARQWTGNDQRLLHDLAEMVSAEIGMLATVSALRSSVRLQESDRCERQRQIRMLLHDLRTPVWSIVSSIELIGRTLTDPTPEQSEYLRLASQAGEMLDQMIRETFTEGGGGDAYRIGLPTSSLLRRSAGLIRPLVEKNGLKLVVETLTEGELSADTVRDVSRVLLNFLTNAVKYSPTGGAIVLSARQVRLGERMGLRFEVRDQGPGVPEAERESIFLESFMGSKAGVRGPESYGLGLAFCKAVAIRYGGSVGVEDAEGGGSIFFLQFPA